MNSYYSMTKSIPALCLLILLTITIVFPAPAYSEKEIERPTVIVSQSATVQGSAVLLSDIAKISSMAEAGEDLVERLKNIVLIDSPAPKTSSTLLADKILEIIENNGISRESFGYSIPRIVTIERAGRAITKEEVQTAVRNALSKEPTLDIQVREVQLPSTYIVPVGATELKATIIGKSASGSIPVQIEVFVNAKPEARFSATAVVDDWREVPVLNRQLDRGMLIDPTDLQLVRLNLYKHPADIVDRIEDAIGKRAKSQLAAGETIRKSFIDIPPVVPRGKKINVTYKIKSLSASATGIALEDGFEGSVIRVQNESSRKVLQATVVSEHEVEVQAK